MRRSVIILCLALGACANPTLTAYKAKVQAEQTYVSENMPRFKSGELKASDYYAGFYALATQPPVLPQDMPAIKASSAMIDAARDLEAGRISPQEFDKRRRDALNAGMEENNNIQAQQAAADEARRRLALQYFLQTRPVTTNCRSWMNGASCTTY
jgi:hypothetical protein